MINLLNQLEQLGNDLKDALINMDANRVTSLSFLQETCLQQLQRELAANPGQTQEFKEHLLKISDLHQLNRTLLENAMKITDHRIQEAFKQNNVTFNELG